MYAIYGLEDQRTHEIFYVGMTDDIQSRFLSHLRCDGSNPFKDTRIREMVSAGYLPLPRTLQLVVDVETAKRREAYWMRHFHDMGMPLTNQVMPLIPANIVIVRGPSPEKARILAKIQKMSKTPQRGIPDETRNEIIALYKSGMGRTQIKERLRVAGDQYWQLRDICDQVDRAQKEERA